MLTSNDARFCPEGVNEREALRLHDLFRLLWEQHIYWTRMVIISIAADSSDLNATVARLLRNADDFARVFRRLYGEEIANDFARLLTDHLTIAAELVKAAKAGNTAAAADAERRWYANADEISAFLYRLNPNWEYRKMRKMWYDHLALTKAEAVARLQGDFPRDIAIFEKIEQLALLMADMFSNVIICSWTIRS